MDLKDKVVVITGASYGLGREIAVKMADGGAQLALIARGEPRLKELQNELLKKNTKSEYFLCDVSDPYKVKFTAEQIIKSFGNVDILINNAGQWFEGILENHEDKTIEDLFKINSIGPVLVTKAFLPSLKRSKSGIILNIVSIAGVETPGEHGIYSVYTATKSAVHGFTTSLREELKGEGIKVLGIYPPGMNTEIFDRSGFHYNDIDDWSVDKKEIADIVKFMLTRPDDLAIDQLVIHKFSKP